MHTADVIDRLIGLWEELRCDISLTTNLYCIIGFLFICRFAYMIELNLLFSTSVNEYPCNGVCLEDFECNIPF